MADATFAEAAQKVDGEWNTLDQDDETLAALEEELGIAQHRFEAAEARFGIKFRQQEAELAKPFDEKKTQKASVPADVVKLETIDAPDHKEPTLKGSADTKNTSAKSTKEAKREKWESKRDAANRVRDATRKGRDKIRKAQRDKNFERMDEEAPAVAAPAPAPAAAEAAKPKSSEPAFDSEVVKAGAGSLAERLRSLKDRPNDVERKAALVRVLTGGKPNYYTSEPEDILDNLEGRGLIDADFTSLLLSLLRSDPAKGAGVPPEDWLEHAKKVSGVTRKDDEPYTESEDMYLKWVDKHSFAEAEAELDAAEAKLQELIQLSDVWYGAEETAEETAQVPAEAPLPLSAHADYADKLESQVSKKDESKGAKNTSQLSSKVVSKEKWLTNRRQEVKERESGKKARSARRAEARDLKHDV